MRQTRATPRHSTDRLGRLSRALLIAALTAAVLAGTCTAAVAQSSELHTEWTETDATHTVTREEASARINAMLSSDEKAARSQVVIDNSGALSYTLSLLPALLAVCDRAIIRRKRK